jgi:hypothetical protein
MQPKPLHKLQLHKGKSLKVQPRLQPQIHKRKRLQYKQASRLMQPKPHQLKRQQHQHKLFKAQPRLSLQIRKCKLLRCKLA